MHGLGEHSGRYKALARALNDAGWDVGAADLRGHGRSDGARGRLPSDDAMYADLADVIDMTAATDAGSAAGRPGSRGRPLVLVGHSMGGAIAARFVAERLRKPEARARWFRRVDALVLSSPALDPGSSPMQRLLIAGLRPLAPNLALGNGLKPQWISRDAAVVAAYRADPLVHDRVSPRLARMIADAGAFTLGAASHWRVPTLLMWAGDDHCVRAQGSERFAAAAPAGVVTSVPWPTLAHEILNEPEREAVVARLLAWLDGLRFDTRRDRHDARRSQPSGVSR